MTLFDILFLCEQFGLYFTLRYKAKPFCKYMCVFMRHSDSFAHKNKNICVLDICYINKVQHLVFSFKHLKKIAKY